MRVYNESIESNIAMNASFNSAPIELVNIFGFAIQVVWTGTPTGTFKLQASADKVQQGPPGGNAPTNWTDIANTSQAVSAAGNYMWNVSDVMYNWVRLVYTDGSGGTSLAVLTSGTINSKGM